MIAGAERLGAVLARVRALRLVALVGAVLVLGIAFVALTVPPARADGGTGSLKFTLTNYTGGGAASGGCMEVYDTSQAIVGSDCVGMAGVYRLDGLAPGTYKVKLTNFAGAAPTQWYFWGSNFATASSLTVSAGAITPYAYTLMEPRSITGWVKNASNVGLGGGYVEVWDSTNYFAPEVTVAVAANGYFSTPQLACASCKMRFHGFAGLRDEWRGYSLLSVASDSVAPNASSYVYTGVKVLGVAEAVISGTIARPSNFTSDTACVLLYENGTWGRVVGTQCGVPGDTFVFHNVNSYENLLCVADTPTPTTGCSGASYLWDFFGGATATDATMVGGTTVAPLAFGGTISATPTSVTGGPVTAGCMDVYAASTQAIVGSDCVGAGGTYTVAVGVDSHVYTNYRAKFRDFPGRIDQWYNAASSLATATPVNVQSGASVALSGVQLRSPATDGSIALALTNWGSGTNGAGGCMQVFNAASVQVGQDCAGVAGLYTVGNLSDGFYRVSLSGFTGAAPTQWYSLGNTFATATPVAIDSGSHFAGAYELVVPYSIIGKVVDASGNPLGGGDLEIWDFRYFNYNWHPSDGPVASWQLRADGTFATGDARVSSCPLPRFAGFAGLANEWYGTDASPPHGYYYPCITPNQYSPVLISTQTINWSEGVLQGTIAVPPSFTTGSACVSLFQLDGQGDLYQWRAGLACGTVGSAFEFHNLAPATYAICVEDGASPSGSCADALHTANFVGGGSAQEAIRDGHGFVVTEGGTTTVTLAFGGTITSTPTVAGGGEVTGGCMEVYSAETGPLLASDCTPESGTFSVSLGENSGYNAFRVKFSGIPHVTDEWYHDATSQATATSVKVSAGETVSLAVELAPWGTVSGDITLPAGSSDDHACVGVTDRATFSDHVCTAPGETGYVISVPPRRVWLEFYTETPATAFQLYDNVAAKSDAMSVTVPPGANRVISATLADAAEISGGVTLSNGAVALGGCVEAYEADGDYVYSRCVNGSGHYVLDSLPAGDYKLLFAGFTGGADAFYGGAPDLAAATTITVAAGDAKVANMVLARPGTISGTVTRPGGGPALGGCAVAYDVAGDVPVRVSEGCANASGQYSLQVPPGAYAVLFAGFHDAAGGALQDQWNADAATSDAARTVAVGDNGVTKVSAALASGAITLRAVVTAATGGFPATGGCSRVYDEHQALVTERCTGVTNTWDAAIPTGTYYVESVGYSFIQDSVTYALSAQWADNKATFLESDPVVAAVGSGPRGYYLFRGATYVGTVTLPSGAASEGWVELYNSTTRSLDYWTAVAPDGTYGIADIVGGPYRVLFGGFTGAADEWYDNQVSFGSASSRWPDQGVTATFDATLAPEGVLAGTMTVPSDFTGATACVTAYFEDGYFAGEACAGVGQPFAIHHLPASTVRLEFSDSGHHRLYQTNVWATAVPFTISTGVTTNAAIAWTAPSVTGVSPGFGPPDGGTTVTITGSGLSSVTRVTFDGLAGANLSVVSDTELTVTTPAVTTPAGTGARAPVVVTNPVGDSAPSFFAYLDPSQSVVAGSPVRVLDTSGFTPGVVRCYPVVGLGFVPDGATGVLLNVTAVGPSGNGYVVIYPDTAGNGATTAPNSSTVNFEPGKDVANSAMVALPADGKVCAYSAGGTLSRLILDVAGYVVPGSGITIQSAQRLLDTRQSGQQVTGPVAPSVVSTVQVTGNAGVPAGATAVVANVTVVGPTAEGHLRVWAAGTPVPNTSVVNYAPGQTKANGQIIALSPGGGLSFESFTGAGTATNPVQVIIDVVGYVSAGSQYAATAPTRIVETRATSGIVGPIPGALVPNTVYPVTLSDTSLIPSSATAVVLNVTAVGPTAFGNLRVYPDTNGLGTTAPPLASNLNYIPGRAIPNMVIVQIPPDRKIDFYNNQGLSSSRTHLIVDVIGYIDAPF
jgi:hypothetical protein